MPKKAAFSFDLEYLSGGCQERIPEMKILKNCLIVAVALVALGSIGTIMNHVQNPAALRAGDDGGPKVTIAAPLPLPVNVTGTPGVNVNNTPNVHIANSPTVEVGNTSSSPVVTRSVDNPGLQPYQISVGGSSWPINVPVPSGKTLVIEHFNMVCFETAANLIPNDFRLATSVNGIPAGYVFAPTQPPGLPGELITNQVTHIYATGGTIITIGVGAIIPPGTNCDASLAGHLVSPL